MGTESTPAFGIGDKVDCYLGTRMKQPFATGTVVGTSSHCERWIRVKDDATGKMTTWDLSCLETPKQRHPDV